ncbi:MAG: hypothetical protein ACLQU2_00560 [Candidatus Binataceae bacterium]
MNPSPVRFNYLSRPRQVMRALRNVLAAAWAELRRINSLGLCETGATELGRTERAARVRDALSRAYRDRSTCC